MADTTEPANDNAVLCAPCAPCADSGSIDGRLCGACYGNGHTTAPRERRDAARDIAALTRSGHVEAVGIEAAWSATMGAAHTLAAARGAGLSITRIVFDVRPQNDR